MLSILFNLMLFVKWISDKLKMILKILLLLLKLCALVNSLQVFFADEDIMALPQLSRYRVALVDEYSDWKRKCIALLDQVFPEYSKLFSDTFGVTSKELLSKYPLPEDMINVDTEILTKLISKTSKGRFTANKAIEIKERAQNTSGVSFAKNAFSFQIKQIISQISFIESQIEELEVEISSLLHSTNQVITTITGIGNVLGAIIIGEIGDISRSN